VEVEVTVEVGTKVEAEVKVEADSAAGLAAVDAVAAATEVHRLCSPCVKGARSSNIIYINYR
jgi:hypothetical protein